MPELGLVDKLDREAKDQANLVRLNKSYSLETWTQTLYPPIKQLWHNPVVQEAFSRASEYQLNDSAPYFFANIDRIAQVEYVPSVQDILQARVKTTGIVESRVQLEDHPFLLLDVCFLPLSKQFFFHLAYELSL